MNEERLLLKGRKVEHERDLARLNEQAQGACVAIRLRLNPSLEPEPENWDTANILEMAKRLDEVVGKMREISRKLKTVKEALGDE